jgi:hypothetical protein
MTQTRQIIWQANINDAVACVVQRRNGSISVEKIDGDPVEHSMLMVAKAAEDAEISGIIYVDERGMKEYERQAGRKRAGKIKRQKVSQADLE